MSIKQGDLAPEISGANLVTDAPWSLKGQAPAHLVLAFVGITGGSPGDMFAGVLEAAWNSFKSSQPPFVMAIIAGYQSSGLGGVAKKETIQDLKAAIQKFKITIPVILSPDSWFTYLFMDVPGPALYCLHWEAASTAYRVAKMKPSWQPGSAQQQLNDLLAACGIGADIIPIGGGGGPPETRPLTPPSVIPMPVFMQFLGGPTSDGGGIGITFGGHPIPIPPWDPLRALGPSGRDAQLGLWITGLAAQIGDADSRNQLSKAGIHAIKTALAHLEQG